MQKTASAQRKGGWAWLIATLLVSVTAGCHQPDPDPAQMVPGGDADVGRDLIRAHGCVNCHAIPGVRGADGTVGPPLIDFARRSFIAGAVPNETGHLVIWIQDPQAIEPGTAMPTLGVSESEARHIAAYLYTLR